MTQVDRILRHIQDHGSITPVEAMKEYGVMRLAARISDIKKAGYHVKAEKVTGINRYGEPTRYSRYEIMEADDESARTVRGN